MRMLRHEDCKSAVLELTRMAVADFEGGGNGNEASHEERRLAEKMLARALLRWSQLQHFQNTMSVHPPSIACDTKERLGSEEIRDALCKSIHRKQSYPIVTNRKQSLPIGN